MISRSYFRYLVRRNAALLFVFFVGILFYMTAVTGMYSVETGKSINALLATIPKQLLDVLGMQTKYGNLTEFYVTHLFEVFLPVFPMIFGIILSERLIVRNVETGASAYLFSTTITRKSFAVTGAFVHILGLFFLVLSAAFIGIFMSQMIFPGELLLKPYIQMALGLFLLHMLLGSIGFFASCLFNRSVHFRVIGIGVPVVFYFLYLLSGLETKGSIFEYFTVFNLYRPEEILQGKENGLIYFLLMGILAVVLYAAGVCVFQKKKLPVQY